MKCKYKTCAAALCIAAVSLAGCSKGSAPAADITNSITSAAQSGAVSEEELISLEAAENAALAHAGIAESEAKITKSELDRDKGNYEYEIEFTAKDYKYEYDINAKDGSVKSFSKEAVSSGIAETAAKASPPPTVNPETQKRTETETAKPETTTSAGTTQNSAASPSADKTITAEEAKAAALKHAGLNASEVTFTKAELDYDDGIAEYDIEFNSEANEYEYEINAATGMVIKYSKEALDLPAMKNFQSTITLEEAKTAALKYAGLTDSEVKFTKTELDHDDGVPEYKIKFKYDRKEYEFKIDAYSGEILKVEID